MTFEGTNTYIHTNTSILHIQCIPYSTYLRMVIYICMYIHVLRTTVHGLLELLVAGGSWEI